MTCTIDNRRTFNFYDWRELCDILTGYDDYNCKGIIIADTRDRIHAVINKGNFMYEPHLANDTKYYLYGIPGTVKMMDADTLAVGNPVPVLYDVTYELLGTSFYISE